VKAKILIVEDQFIEANNLQRILESAGYKVCSIARSVPIALKIIEKESPDLVLVDIYLQGNLTGIDLAIILAERGIAFVYISANSNKLILDAAKSTKPYGFLVKPFREKDVLVMLDVAWYLHQHKKDSIFKDDPSSGIAKEDQNYNALNNIIGNSPGMVELVDNIKIVGASDTSVLILGESGTGKELVAQAIHRISSRRNKPLIVVNCAALPANLIESELFGHEKGAFTGALYKRIGKFEQADGGTIFLDEIGELPPDLQVRFLRVLQEKEIESIGGHPKKINVRVIAATNRKLEEEMAMGRFRIDLFYRLNIFPLSLPPLRDRGPDVIILAEYFLKRYSLKQNKTITGFSQLVIKAIQGYSWPGNVRELENMMERSVLLANGSTIDTLVLPKDTSKMPDDYKEERVKTMEENERDHILSVLQKCDWKVSGEGGAAEMLDINVSTLNSRIRKLGIEKNRPDPKK
jgi:two-component system response regulator HydG